MTGAVMVLLSEGSLGIVPTFSSNSSDEATSPGSSSSPVSFNSTGTISSTSSNGLGGATNWYMPFTTNIGSSYWIKFTALSGAAWVGGIVAGQINSLSTTRTVSWNRGGIGTTSGSANVFIYSDSLGNNLVAQGTCSGSATVFPGG